MPAASMDWTDEKVAELKRLIDAGYSGSVAARMMKTTRSTLIGKARRLGWHFKSDDLSRAGNVGKLSNATVWSRADEGQLKRMWAANATMQMMCESLNRTRGGIYGKAVALGLPRRTQTPKSAPPSPIAIAKRAKPAMGVPETARHWMTRRFGECAAPVSGEGADTLYCCAPSIPGRSWCPSHAARFFARAA